jgi:hypothetical protein
VRYDVGAVKNKLKSDFKNEKFVLKGILKKEFGSKDGQEKGAEDNTNPLKEDKTPLFGKNKKKKEKKGATQDNQPVIEWNDN